MANFYAKYPAQTGASGELTTVQGEGTAGSPTGGVLTVQGDPSGTPIPISGSITAASASVGPTGSPVPADADYIGYSVSGTLTGATGTANGLKVDGSAVTQPVSQSGTWNIDNISGTVTLPTGAATAAKQPALGTAGTASADVITVQGIASMTALKVDGTGGTFPISGTVAVTQSTSPWVTSASQSGTWTVQPGNTANTTPWLVTGSGTAGTAASGVVTIQGIASMTAVKTDPSGLTTSTATFQAEGAIAFGSITNSYATILTPSASTKILQMRNNTNAAISVSFDAGTTTNYTLDAGDQVSLDLWSNSLVMSTTAIQIKYAVGAPTSGSFRVNACH